MYKSEFSVFTHVMRRPCWCTKQWQNVAQVLHNNRIKFPKDYFRYCSVHQHGRRDVRCKSRIHETVQGLTAKRIWIKDPHTKVAGRTKKSGELNYFFVLFLFCFCFFFLFLQTNSNECFGKKKYEIVLVEKSNTKI